MLALGTFVSDGPEFGSAATAAVMTAARPATPSIQRMRRFIVLPSGLVWDGTMLRRRSGVVGNGYETGR